MFKDAANGTISVGGQLYGLGGMEEKAVKNAWTQVGV
jgi:Zn-dependent metalloprotease